MSCVDALPPFSGRDVNSNGLDTDVILRSSDSVDYHTYQSLLAFVSPVFKDMFTFPQPLNPGSHDFRNGKPVVQLTEPSDALRNLLIMCYPQAMVDGVFVDLDGICLAYDAAEKYQIPGAKSAILATLGGARFLKDPYRLFAVACRLGLEDLADSAARATLQDRFMPRQFSSEDHAEYMSVSAEKLLRLHGFHRRCGEAAAKSVKQYIEQVSLLADAPWHYYSPWWETEGHDEACGPSTLEDQYGGQDEYALPADWFRDHMMKVAELVSVKPSGEYTSRVVVDYEATLRRISRCAVCSQDSARWLIDIARSLEAEVEKNNTRVIISPL
jgi:hypothetical protein